MDISSIAVLGSLGASVVLGSFMAVQAYMDPVRRGRFAAFSAVCWGIGLLDLLLPRLGLPTYELFRVFAWSAYGSSVLLLLEIPRRWSGLNLIIFSTIGVWIWSHNPFLATTVIFPPILIIAGLAHLRQFNKNRGYASCVLAAFSFAMGLECTCFYAALQTQNDRTMGLGFFHFAFLTSMAVLFGWIHLPRELRGQAPVRVDKRHAWMVIGSILAAEIGTVLSIFAFPTWPPVLYIVSTAMILLVTLVLYFYNRHQLVIYTENVSMLLEERTASLRSAQEELARQNEVQAQKLDEQAQELEAKAAVIDRQRRLELAAQTAGQAAHDIQNLISPILLQVSRLQKETESSQPLRDLADRIRKHVEHLLDLNSQLLALSRRGRVEMHPVRLDELLHELKDRFPEKRLDLKIAEHIWIEGSWSQLSRAVSNLVTNALEADPDRDYPVVMQCFREQVAQTRRCHLGFLNPGTYAVIQVEDKGPGIPRDIVERIFEPFFSSKTGRQRSGSGLGLTIVSAVVDDHKGILDLKTSASGTCFTIYLPAIEAPTSMVDVSKLSGEGHILLVDDDPSILQHYGKMLEEAGYTVVSAKSGQEALQILQIEQMELLIVDLKMPQMGGIETFFASMHLRPGIRAIVHSSYVSTEEDRKLRELGISAVILKPASKVELLQTVRHVMSEQHAAPR